jgi:PST family polysaccharide transporter
MAKLGYGYWALVTMTLTLTLTTAIGLWLTTAWVPGPPRRGVGIRSIMRFGGTITLNGLVTYTAYNLEKVLLGRFWGVEAIGIYGRAYQLITIPTDNLNSSVGEVAFSALSRVKNDGIRLKSYFLKGYSLVLGLTIPITIVCALFADDVVAVVLGPRWKAAAIICRFLAPTILIFAMINPLSWLLFSLGMVGRSLKIALVLGPLVIIGYLVGLPYGPKGVASGYSIAMGLWVVPHIIWCVRGTVVSFKDILLAVSRPLFSGLVAAIPAFGVYWLTLPFLPTFPRLLLECATLCFAYIAMLLYVMGQKRLYMDVLRGFRNRSHIDEKALATA